MVSRNLERANENDGFKMTALENNITDIWLIPLDHVTYGFSFSYSYILFFQQQKYRIDSRSHYRSAIVKHIALTVIGNGVMEVH